MDLLEIDEPGDAVTIDDEVAGMGVGQRHRERLRRAWPSAGAMPRISAQLLGDLGARAGVGHGLVEEAHGVQLDRFQRLEERICLARDRRASPAAAAARGCAPACRPSAASSSGRRGARPSMKSTISAPPGRPARGSIARAGAACDLPARDGETPRPALARRAGRRRIAFVRIGDARQQAVGQAHMAVRRAGRRAAVRCIGAQVERRRMRPLTSSAARDAQPLPAASCLRSAAASARRSCRAGSGCRAAGAGCRPSRRLQAPVEPGSAKM